jgi:hypothetical protein
MAGLVAGLAQAAARHVGAGVSVRAAHHENVRAEIERRMRPLPADDGEGVAAAQPDLVLVPASELVEAVSLDARSLGYAVPEKRAKKKERRAAAAQVPQVPRATLARRREEAEGPPSYESRALATQAVAEALVSAREAEAEAPTPDHFAPKAVGPKVAQHLMDVRKKLLRYLTELAGKGEQVTMCKAADGRLYPRWQFAAAFGRWLALGARDRRSRASVWETDGAERMLQRSMARSGLGCGTGSRARAAPRSLEAGCAVNALLPSESDGYLPFWAQARGGLREGAVRARAAPRVSRGVASAARPPRRRRAALLGAGMRAATGSGVCGPWEGWPAAVARGRSRRWHVLCEAH